MYIVAVDEHADHRVYHMSDGCAIYVSDSIIRGSTARHRMSIITFPREGTLASQSVKWPWFFAHRRSKVETEMKLLLVVAVLCLLVAAMPAERVGPEVDRIQYARCR